MRDLIELPGTDLYAVELVICTNAETVLSARDVEAAGATGCEIVADASEAASNAIYEALGNFAGSSDMFSDWHGGPYYGSHPDVAIGHLVANFFSREIEETDEDGDHSYSEWGAANPNWIPAELREKVSAAMQTANAAMDAELDKWEASATENRARFAAEEADA
jgi:hypothetical protein